MINFSTVTCAVVQSCASDPAYEPPDSHLSNVEEAGESVLCNEHQPTVSGWLLAGWDDARIARKESVWNSFPEKMYLYLEAESVLVTSADLAFMAQVASESAVRSPAEVQAAIRLLGIIGEDGFARKDTVRPYLLDLMRSPYAEVRTASVEAIWQINDMAAIPALREALRREKDQGTKLTLVHVLKVLT